MLNTKTSQIVAAVILLVLGVVIGRAIGGTSVPLGGTTNYDSLELSGTLSVGGATTLTGATTFTGDATISGGTLNVSTSNTATSTVKVGCIQTTATSTATPIKQEFVTTGATSTYAGTVYWSYGTCPNL